MSEAAKHWAEQSEYDLDTARAMLASNRYLYVLFCCQQAVEKALKAIIVSRTATLPPRIHNLVRLAEEAGIVKPVERTHFLGELSAYYIQSRYPEDIRGLASTVTREMAGETLASTEEMISWLLSMIE